MVAWLETFCVSTIRCYRLSKLTFAWNERPANHVFDIHVSKWHRKCAHCWLPGICRCFSLCFTSAMLDFMGTKLWWKCKSVCFITTASHFARIASKRPHGLTLKTFIYIYWNRGFSQQWPFSRERTLLFFCLNYCAGMGGGCTTIPAGPFKRAYFTNDTSTWKPFAKVWVFYSRALTQGLLKKKTLLSNNVCTWPETFTL